MVSVSNYLNQRIWSLPTTQRIRLFLWEMAQWKLMCNKERKKRHLTTVNACPVCKCQIETVIHALRECSMAKKLWQELGVDKGWKQVVIQCDSKVIVFLLQEKAIGTYRVKNFLAICKRMISQEWRMQVHHIYREANSVADDLANLTFSNGLGFKLIIFPPAAVCHLLDEDKDGVV
uniref:RNase H type-1 domain-containing protein n=1 Tax=Manihot esculenta TaxID=3983 RepID=A0A2C9UZM4_MANES